MQLPSLEFAYFLQALGWGMIHSLWQIAILWGFYKSITGYNLRLSANARYLFSLSLMAISFSWFLSTVFINYGTISTHLNVENLVTNNILLIEQIYTSNILPLLAIIYLISLSYFTLRFARKLFGNHLIQTAGQSKAPFQIRIFTKRTAQHIGITKKVQVWISNMVDVPVVTGHLKPIILLPISIISHLNTQQIEAVLLHELAHVKRNDYLVNLFQSAIELVLFFNPFIYFLSKAARLEREYCCDDRVLNFQYDHREYARALLCLEEQRHLKLNFALAATSNKKHLLHRIKRLFAEQKNKPNQNFYGQLIVFVIILLFSSWLVAPVIAINNETSTKLNARKNIALIDISYAHNQTKSAKSIAEKAKIVVVAIARKEQKQRKKTVLRQNEPPTNYLNAYINEDLLKPVNTEIPIANFIAEKQTNEPLKYYIEIEEQQSGKKQVNTYFLEVKETNGAPEVKPLIILNKLKAAGQQAKTLNDTIVKPLKVRNTS